MLCLVLKYLSVCIGDDIIRTSNWNILLVCACILSFTGNVMTSIRECQALMSLKLINKSLQNMILSGSFASTPSNVASTSSSASAPVPISGPFSTRINTNSAGSNASSSGATSADLTPRKLLLEQHKNQPLRCPENVPLALWLALSRQYNESQLRAICMVSRRYQEKEYMTQNGVNSSNGGIGSGSASSGLIDSSLSLLQGPPGTGKTRTILGIVSVFLAGALNITPQGTTRIVAGASLYGETNDYYYKKNLKNASKSSLINAGNELHSRPRSGSLSGSSGTVNANTADVTSITTGAAAASSVAVNKTRVLICAPSNTAVDEVVFRLITQVRKLS